MSSIEPKLTDIPETMLWTLHNRADEVARPDSVLDDPLCLEIYQSLTYDYERSFGKADASHGTRSWLFDRELRYFLANHPNGVIVNLGEGLETQRFRVPTEQALWLSVDLPESIAIRERFIQADEQHLHISLSALDEDWFKAVPPNRPVFITAQGLFMYFTENQVCGLLRAMHQHLPGAQLLFDYIPPWLSAKTLSKKGWMKTPHYRAPDMPWGIYRNDIAPRFSEWLGTPVTADNIVFLYPRGLRRHVILLIEKIPYLRNKVPGVSLVQIPR